MEPVWNGVLTCDYERTRPQASHLEWDLYTEALIRWPLILMDDPMPYGQLRRAGIVDIPEPTHRDLTSAWHRQLARLDYAVNLITRATHDRDVAGAVLDRVDDARRRGDVGDLTRALAAATAAFTRVNATHIVNWLLPEDHWERLLADLFGSRDAALICLSALQLPAAPGHILATQMQLPRQSEAATALDVEMAARQQEQAAPAAGLIAQRTRAARRREAWTTAALLAAAGNDQVVTEIRAMALLLGWAADSEERRKELRERFLTAAHAWCDLTGTDPSRIAAADLQGADADARR
ncbi:hypothetical protein I6A84_31880 [Frankia sp. CNm7]|uniref:Uncharacterized protein n=1 Tax=Frankia nepalensis TaxID=1836974 RepID=A0A937RKY8_9ACTN|nr:hypothetical protein [Frankia nepalensis]MBL7499279.1 hypothetical protein [Frankia nepalensis]MBL7512373.1 hypothetical protein [Frankia nepalensis]MBL7522564.1 hypothetical protein [Frankia nepalensis]MBL7632195.1 hypothetical protein [Frankia nepalensis]